MLAIEVSQVADEAVAAPACHQLQHEIIVLADAKVRPVGDPVLAHEAQIYQRLQVAERRRPAEDPIGHDELARRQPARRVVGVLDEGLRRYAMLEDQEVVGADLRPRALRLLEQHAQPMRVHQVVAVEDGNPPAPGHGKPRIARPARAGIPLQRNDAEARVAAGKALRDVDAVVR